MVFFGKDCGFKVRGNKGFLILGSVIGRCLKLSEIFFKVLGFIFGNIEFIY